jgi:hypothetical protein
MLHVCASPVTYHSLRPFIFGVNNFLTLDNFIRLRYRYYMAELRVKNFNDDLMARMKSAAVLARCTVKEFVETLIAEALRRREGRKRP